MIPVVGGVAVLKGFMELVILIIVLISDIPIVAVFYR